MGVLIIVKLFAVGAVVVFVFRGRVHDEMRNCEIGWFGFEFFSEILFVVS